MSVSIKRKAGDDTARIFILEDKPPTLPPGNHQLSNKDQAKKSGFYGAGMILADTRVQSVTLFSSTRLKGYVDGPWDCIEVALKDGLSWDNMAKAPTAEMAGQLKTAAQKTIAQSYADIMEIAFIKSEKAFYRQPDNNNSDYEVGRMVDQHLTRAFMSAVSTKEQFNAKVARGERTTVHDTIRSDNGLAKFKSCLDGVVTIQLSGNCGNNCVNDGDTSATETGLKADLGPAFPFVRQWVFEKQL